MPTGFIIGASTLGPPAPKVTIYGMARTNWLKKAGLIRDGSLTLGTLLERLAEVHGDQVLVDEAGRDGAPLTYRQAAARVAVRAGAMAGLIEPGDRVVVATPNAYDAFLLCVAASRAGGIAVPVNPQMTDAEVEHVITDSGATLVIRDADEIGTAAPLTKAVPAA